MTVFAPGVAQIRWVGVIGGNPFANVYHWFTGTSASWTQAQIQTMATTAFSAYHTHLLPLMSSEVQTQYCEAVDLTDATERSFRTTTPGQPGQAAGKPPTKAACIAVSHQIGTRYRGGHPRTYLPPAQDTQTNDGDTWLPGLITATQTAWQALRDQINTALVAAGVDAATDCVPRYTYSYTADTNKHKFLKERTAFQKAWPVTGFNVSNQIRSQRRRLGP